MFDKVGCAFPMVISSDFRMGKYRDDDHEEDAPYFILPLILPELTSESCDLEMHILMVLSSNCLKQSSRAHESVEP